MTKGGEEAGKFTKSAPSSGARDVSIEDHPLFISRVPSAKDFKNNALLSALAALIDEDEEEQQSGPQRRQRHKLRSAPWISKQLNKSLQSATTSNTPNQRTSPPSTGQMAYGPSEDDFLNCVAASSELSPGTGGPEDYSLQETGVDCKAGGREEIPSGPEKQQQSSSLGELQICMRLFSMK